MKGARGRLWQGLFMKFEGPFFPCTQPKSSSAQNKTHVYLLRILLLLLLHHPQSEGNWERAEWPTPKRVMDYVTQHQPMHHPLETHYD